MPADPPALSQPIIHCGNATSRLWLTAAGALALVTGECIVLIWLLRGINLRLPLAAHVLQTTQGLLLTGFAGFVAHFLFSAIRKRGRRYLRAVATPRFIGVFLMLFVTLVLLMVFYASLKVMVPLLNERIYDDFFWRIDTFLFFGMSPNVFLVNLLDHSLLLRFIDWGYGYFFLISLLTSFPLFLPHVDDRIRVSFISANVLLWSAGAWLYLTVPSLGPAYSYHEIWDSVRQQFPISTYWQKHLIDNYQLVLRIPHGTIGEGFNMFEGIGAFPSMHVGFQGLFALYLGRLSRVAGRVAWLLVFLTFLGSVLTGWHYLVDSIAGLLLAVGIFLLMERVVLPEAGENRSGETA
ncbi:MAG: phosphatase PAP2 family protein [Acidobacteria bacterium]|nr:phosphatase PAP2 family protein [Acidobacteriota bacterium]